MSTVKWYVRQIYGKLGVENRQQAIARAEALGLILPDAASPAPESNLRPRHNLPTQTTPFIGREQECADLANLLAADDIRLVTILAPGGMGKTRLGLAVAETQLDHFADGVYMVPLAALQTPDQIVAAIADATGFPLSESLRSPHEQVLNFLGSKHMLLLLDNFEHILDGADFVDEILRAAPCVHVLITSRERLNLSSEAVFTIGGMIFPDWETPEDACEYDAVQLFMQRAELTCPDFELHADDLQFPARICRLVEGMPLGIVLAAAWTDLLSLAEIADEIQHSFDFLETDMRDIPRRQWSIRAVFDPTWDRLSDRERAAFMRLSVFRGGFTRAAAQTVAGANLRILQSLFNKALMDRDATGRYTIHELLRQYVAEQLDAAGLTAEARQDHCTYFMDFMAERDIDIKYRRQLAARTEIDPEFENVRLAWQWAIAQHDFDTLNDVAECLWIFGGSYSGYLDERRAMFQEVIDQLPADDADMPPVAVTMLWYIDFHEHNCPLDVAERCQVIAQHLNQPKLLASAQFFMGTALAVHGSATEGLAAAEDALARFQALNDQFWTGFALAQVAHSWAALGESEKSIEVFQQAAEHWRALGDENWLSNILVNLAIHAIELGDFAEARRLVLEGINLETVRLGFGFHEQLNGVMGWLDFLAGDFDESRRLMELNLEYALEINHPTQKSLSLDQLGDLAVIDGDYELAQQHYERMVELGPEGFRDHIPWGAPLLAYIRGDYATAQNYLHHILEKCVAYFGFQRMTMNLPAAALIRAKMGDPIGATELLGLAFNHPLSATGWLEGWELVDDLRTTLANELGAAEFAAAWERGAQLDLATVAADLVTELADPVSAD